MKTCSKCHKILDLNFFHKGNRFKDGYNVWCKYCMQDYAILNSETIKLSKQKHYEKIRRASEETRRIKKEIKLLEAPIRKEKALEKRREYSKLRRINNPELKKLSDKKYRENNRESRNRKDKERKLRDPQYNLTVSMRIRLNKAIKNNQKIGSAIEDLGCSIDYFCQYIESFFYTHSSLNIVMSWKNYGRGIGKWNLDHKIPLYKFDLTNREQLLRACHYTNLQPLWAEDHITKTSNDIKKNNSLIGVN